MNAVKIHRLKKDMTGIELADAVGVDPGYISQVERYDTMAEGYAKLVAKALGVKLLDLFDPAEREGRYRAKNVKVTVK
jgi:transcriptional regulator with XRE-family HTH domain